MQFIGTLKLQSKIFRQKKNKKKLFLSTCIVLDSNLNLKKMGQNFPLEVKLDTKKLCMDYVFANLKMIRTHAILNCYAGSVKCTAKKAPGY